MRAQRNHPGISRPRPLRRAVAVCLCALVAAAGPLAVRAQEPPPAGRVLVLVAHPSTSVDTVTLAELRALFSKRLSRWAGGDAVIPLNAPPESDLRRQFDARVMGWSPSGAADYWVRERVRSGTHPPRQVADARVVRAIVARVPGAVGYVEWDGDLRDVKVLKVEGRLPWEPDYVLTLGALAAPARDAEKTSWEIARSR
jgi:ABC-type phosphate transport system substrate-binding protein